MNPCRFEPQLVSAMRAGAWPLGADPELRQHVESCRRCGETVVIAGALLSIATPEPAPPPAGTLWWRAELQRRHQDFARATRPLSWAATFACLATLAGFAAAALWQAPAILAWLRPTGGADASPLTLWLFGGTLAVFTCVLAVWAISRQPVRR